MLSYENTSNNVAENAVKKINIPLYALLKDPELDDEELDVDVCCGGDGGGNGGGAGGGDGGFGGGGVTTYVNGAIGQ
jgi:hypothetical protein